MDNENINEENNIVTLKDEKGNDVRFEFLDYIQYLGENYVVLLPADEDSTEVLILKEGKQIVDGTEDVEYTTIDDENETKEVFEIFKDKFKDEFDFEDDEDEDEEETEE